MQKKLIIIVLIIALGLIYFLGRHQKNAGKSFVDAPTPTITPAAHTKSVFVPYWANMVGQDANDYDRYIYFGVNVDENGVITDDPGYKNMSTFIPFAAGKQKWLTVRMLDHDVNTSILQNSGSWVGIAHSIANTASQNGFDGVVLDLEVGLISFHIAPDSISGFSETVAHEVHSNGLKYGMTMYGDTSFRKRPYDVKTLATNTDELMIMAYDFHKSFGEAGPNFPLNGVDKYNYDFTTMLEDFTSVVPANKLSVVYGMYGYEWIVDDQDRAVKPAAALTFNQIQKRFLNGCSEKECQVRRDAESTETEVTFKDDQGKKHEVWFEDSSSVTKKSAAAEKKGIGNEIFWAYGYF